HSITNGAADAGLSKCHIEPHVGVISIPQGGSCATLTRYRPRKHAPARRHVPRGNIRSCSPKSAQRLRKQLARIPRSEPALHVTLNYPSEFSDSPAIWRIQRRLIVQRLVRGFPALSGFWKLEFQRRGAPHFHFILWGSMSLCEERLARLRSWLAHNWYQVVG